MEKNQMREARRAFRRMRRMSRQHRVWYLRSLPDGIREEVARMAAGGDA